METDIKFNSKEIQIPSLSIQLLYLENRAFSRIDHREIHSHWFWQAEIVLEGSVKVLFQNQEKTIEKGSVLIIPPGIRHGFEYSKNYTEFISFKFHCIGAETVVHPHIYEKSYGAEYLCTYLLSIMQDFDSNRRLIAVHIQNALKTFLELEIVYGTNLPPKSLADQVRDIIKQSEGVFPNVSEVADTIGMSRPYISRMLKQETGLTLKPFIDHECIQIAKQLLRLSDLNISEIATQLGYNDLFSFSKFFKRVENISPTDYHNQYTQSQESYKSL